MSSTRTLNSVRTIFDLRNVSFRDSTVVTCCANVSLLSTTATVILLTFFVFIPTNQASWTALLRSSCGVMIVRPNLLIFVRVVSGAPRSAANALMVLSLGVGPLS